MPIWPFKRALKNSSFDFSISNSSSWKIISCVSPNLNQGVLTSSARSQHEKLYFFSLFFYLVSLLCVLPGDADWAMNKKHHFQNSVWSDNPPQYPSASLLLGASPELQEGCQGARGRAAPRASVQMWGTKHHKHWRGLSIIRASPVVELMIAIVSRAWQHPRIALYYWVLWFCLSSSTWIFLLQWCWI